MRHILSIPVLAPVIIVFILFNLAKDWFGTFLDTESILVEGIILPSQNELFLTFGQVFILIALFGFFLKIARAVLYGPSSIFDRVFSALTTIVAVGGFLFLAACGSGTFFTLVVMAFVDFFAGYVGQSMMRTGALKNGDGGI